MHLYAWLIYRAPPRQQDTNAHRRGVGRKYRERPTETILAPVSKTISMFADRREAPGLVVELVDLVRTLRTVFDPYRPELHYMRGAGPKWHAKHDAAPASVDPRLCLPRSA